ncbi:MAG: DUF4209 domain-containing protein [Caldisericia bacterium]|nr:DUF4209 domain-containing protein [Caldisericia bacterium]
MSYNEREGETMFEENKLKELDSIELLPEDYDDLRVIELIQDKKDGDCLDYCFAFYGEAERLYAAEDFKNCKIFLLLFKACSMILRSNKPNNPFIPYFQSNDRRSSLPSDFSAQELSFLSSIITKISDYKILARVADICWLMGKPRKPEYALKAINSYIQCPLLDSNYKINIKEYWQRAIILSKMIKKYAPNKLIEIDEEIFKTLINLNDENKKSCWMLSYLLRQTGRCNNIEQIAEKIIDLSEKLDNEEKIRLLEEGIYWLKKIDKEDINIYKLNIKKAESFEAQKQFALGYMGKAKWIELAIKEYKMIPKKYRILLNVEDRLNELIRNYKETNEIALSEMIEIKSPSIDMEKYLSYSEKYVSDRSFPDVLFYFINIFNPMIESNLKKCVLEMIKENPLLFIIPKENLSDLSDSRIIKRTPGIDINDINSEQSKQTIWDEEIKLFCFYADFYTEAFIIPALKVIISQHYISEDDIFELIKNCDLINYHRLSLWSKGLHYGFDFDFETAMHILSPQMESLIRNIFKLHNKKTNGIDDNGVETVLSINSLLHQETASELFQEDLLFELKAIFIDPLGFNMRNNIAHGLVDDRLNYSNASVYTWFFCLRLIIFYTKSYRDFRNRKHQEIKNSSSKETNLANKKRRIKRKRQVEPKLVQK